MSKKEPVTPIYKITLYVAEINNVFGLEDIKTGIENALDDNLISFGKCETKDLGEWDDDNKWNFSNKNPDKLWLKTK